MGGGLAPAGHHDQVGAAFGPLDDGLLGVIRHDDVGVDPHAHGLAELARLGDDVLADLDRMLDRLVAAHPLFVLGPAHHVDEVDLGLALGRHGEGHLGRVAVGIGA